MSCAASGVSAFQTHFLPVLRDPTSAASVAFNGSVFRVRNETGSRIRVWSMEEHADSAADQPAKSDNADGKAGATAAAANAVKTKVRGQIVAAGSEQELQLRQSLASLAGPAARQSMFRSPALSIKVSVLFSVC